MAATDPTEPTAPGEQRAGAPPADPHEDAHANLDVEQGHTEYRWYAEIELRNYLKRLFDGTDRDYYVPPNTKRAQFYDPTEPRYLSSGDPAAHEEALRENPYLEVSNDRVVVPMDVMVEDIDSEPWSGYQISKEFRDKIIWFIGAHMPIFEDFRRDHYGNGVDYDGRYDGFQTHEEYYDELDKEAHYSLLQVDKPDPRPVYVRVPPDHPMCELNRIYENRVRDERTLFGLIVGRDAATGTGKTTLAVQLARTWDQNGWSADRATLDPQEYFEKYTDEDTPKGSCIILDEAEQAADNRRSMSGGNIKLSHLWATMRFREIYSLGTMPSASAVDKRLKEYADLYIVVRKRGLAMVYKSKVDDITGEQFPEPVHRIRWIPADDDPEYQKLSQKKAQRMKNYAENYAYSSDEEEIDPDKIRHEAEIEKRNELIRRMDELGFKQDVIAEVVGLERSMISRIANS